jgi:hypothetical protein
VKLTTHLHLVPKSRKRGFICPNIIFVFSQRSRFSGGCGIYSFRCSRVSFQGLKLATFIYFSSSGIVTPSYNILPMQNNDSHHEVSLYEHAPGT